MSVLLHLYNLPYVSTLCVIPQNYTPYNFLNSDISYLSVLYYINWMLTNSYMIFDHGVTMTHYNCVCIHSHHPEDGHFSGQNVLGITVW